MLCRRNGTSLYDDREQRRIGLDELAYDVRAGSCFRAYDRTTRFECTYPMPWLPPSPKQPLDTSDTLHHDGRAPVPPESMR